MKSSVILPLHDSLFAPRVIPLVIELGRKSDITVHVIAFGDELGSRGRSGVPGEAQLGRRVSGRYSEAVRDSVVESVSQQLSAVLGSTRVRSAVRDGEIAAALGNYAREHRAELVVLGAENRDSVGEVEALRFAKRLACDTGSSVFFTSTHAGRTRGTFLADLNGTEAARARLDLALTAARIAGVEELTVQALSKEARSSTQRLARPSLPATR